jgi:hypothetical protein
MTTMRNPLSIFYDITVMTGNAILISISDNTPATVK